MAESQPLKRPRFFNGKLLSAADFDLEQQYFREKFRRHNRSLHGFGVVSGLKVTTSAGKIVITPGLALDCLGNEVVVGALESIPYAAITVNGNTAYVNLRFAEENGDVAAGSSEASTITEGFQVDFAADNCNRGHRHLRARWLACGQSHALTIAKLKLSLNGWRVERGYRPPKIK